MTLRLSYAALNLHLRLFVAALVLGLCFAGSASALQINVTGTVGEGFSTWEFSGTSTSWAFSESLQVDGAFSLSSGKLHGKLNNYQLGDFTSGPFGSFSQQEIALGIGATVTGSTSGSHALEGITFEDLPRFSWFADGAFAGNAEKMTYSGSATAPFEISLLADIFEIGDFQTVTATSFQLGDLTMTFTAVPEPSSTLLIGLGLAGLGATRKQRNTR